MLVDFYHLASTPLERVLPRICERLMENEELLLLVAGEEQLAQLDELLWSYSPDAFLPHGRSDGRAPDKQPILLSAAVEPLNGASNVALADGVWRDEALAFARTFYFFDNNHLESARGSWRALKGNAEAAPRYWKQDPAGKWVQGP
jgi:DNA polymerase-3 subunit chi